MSDIQKKDELFKIIKDLSQVETREIELMLAMFRRCIKDTVNSYMKRISEDFYTRCEFYGRAVEEVREIREEILGGYEREFARISDRYEEQYVNLIFELQEAQSNQKITISNYKKLLDAKESCEDSDEYINYKNKLAELTYKKDNSAGKEEFYELEKALSSLKDPIISYQDKIDVLMEKYGNYCGLEEECFKRLDECKENVNAALDSVMKYDAEWLGVPKKPHALEIVNRFLNRLFGYRKFEKEFISMKKKKIKMIRNNTDRLIEEIRNNTVIYIETLTLYKKNIKQFTKTIS